jgi:hypothetical protein
MTEHYKGQRISELLELIEKMEQRMKSLVAEPENCVESWSLAQFNEVAHGYTSLAIAKAKLTALQGEVK